MGPFVVPRTMASTASATLAVPFKIKGTNYTIALPVQLVAIVLETRWNLFKWENKILFLLVEVKKYIGQ